MGVAAMTNSELRVDDVPDPQRGVGQTSIVSVIIERAPLVVADAARADDHDTIVAEHS